MEKQRTAGVILIGNELLSGRTQDQNLAYIAHHLNQHGIRLMEARIILDRENAIVESVNALRARYDFVFTTGGIGSTHDDITVEAIAKAFDVPLEIHDEALTILKAHYRPDQLNDARMKMAKMPQGARLIPHPIRGAPAFAIENVYVLAGVPRIMKAMFDAVASHELGSGTPMMSASVKSFVTEGQIAFELELIQKQHPPLEIGSYPFAEEGRFGTSIVVRGFDVADMETACQTIERLMRDKGELPLRV